MNKPKASCSPHVRRSKKIDFIEVAAYVVGDGVIIEVLLQPVVDHGDLVDALAYVCSEFVGVDDGLVKRKLFELIASLDVTLHIGVFSIFCKPIIEVQLFGVFVLGVLGLECFDILVVPVFEAQLGEQII
jgi:hypothetical protein